ncbi:MAG: hypothetical protein AVDCRST_MAG53-1962, partial [uncultured Solirubrobacteraceae bacterium]
AAAPARGHRRRNPGTQAPGRQAKSSTSRTALLLAGRGCRM